MKAVLFDLDGTIADTEPLKAEALSAATWHFGGQRVDPKIYKEVMGQSWNIVTGHFFKEASIEIGLDRFDPVFREHYRSLIESKLSDTKNASEFIDYICSKNVKLGLVSSASPWMIDTVLKKLNFHEVFNSIVSGHDVKNHKPHPDAYLSALHKLNVNNSEVVAFEDSDSGTEAALKAGIKVYGMRHQYNQNHDLIGCTAEFLSFKDCLNLLELLN